MQQGIEGWLAYAEGSTELFCTQSVFAPAAPSPPALLPEPIGRDPF